MSPSAATADLRHLTAVHRYLFSGIDPRAGAMRTVTTPADPPARQPAPVPADRLPAAAQAVFDEIADHNRLLGLSHPEFTARLAWHFSHLHYLQVFDRGNELAEKVFWTQVAHRAGYEIAWHHASRSLIRAGLEKAGRRDYSSLQSTFQRLTRPLESASAPYPRQRQSSRQPVKARTAGGTDPR